MSGDEPVDHAAQTNESNVDASSTSETADDERDSPRHLRHDLSEVAGDLGVLTTRVRDLETLVNAHGWVLDGIEDVGEELVAQLNDGSPDGGTEPAGDAPEPREARLEESAPSGRQRGPDETADADPGFAQKEDRPAIDIEVLGEWVHNNIVRLVERKVRGRVDAGPHWCPQWWQHPEAVLRFEGLRRAWETLIPEGGVGLVTYLGYLDATLAALMADAGPFHAGSCKHDRHNDVVTLADQPYPHVGSTAGIEPELP